MWRGHNREPNIALAKDRITYLEGLNKELEKNNQPNELNSLSLMPNHAHEMYHILNKYKFSDMMRNHHSRYGLIFNKRHNRQGKVAYERPKTTLIGDKAYSMRATLYIHANALKAGIVKDAKDYKWSTHKLYAYGKREDWMRNIVFPDWYMELGNTYKKRQRAYRRIFDEYLREVGLIDDRIERDYFFGNSMWIEENKRRLDEWKRSKDPP